VVDALIEREVRKWRWVALLGSFHVKENKELGPELERDIGQKKILSFFSFLLLSSIPFLFSFPLLFFSSPLFLPFPFCALNFLVLSFPVL
jgi:hypothetical protein